MTLYTLATETASGILSDAGLTILIGVTVVFGVLLLLTGVFKAFGVVMSGLEKKTETPAPAPKAAPAAPAAPVVTAAPAVDLGPVMSSAQVRNGIKPEETAVIAAAVAASMPAGQKYTITKIDRAE